MNLGTLGSTACPNCAQVVVHVVVVSNPIVTSQEVVLIKTADFAMHVIFITDCCVQPLPRQETGSTAERASCSICAGHEPRSHQQGDEVQQSGHCGNRFPVRGQLLRVTSQQPSAGCTRDCQDYCPRFALLSAVTSPGYLQRKHPVSKFRNYIYKTIS